MAYMDQLKKAKIAAALKPVMPDGWKYSLSVCHHSRIVCTISAAPVDLLAAAVERRDYLIGETRPRPTTPLGVNTHHPAHHFEGELLETLSAIIAALNTDNFGHPDPMTDYFHVGHYVDLQIGRWDRPFRCTAEPAAKVVPVGSYGATDWTGAAA